MMETIIKSIKRIALCSMSVVAAVAFSGCNKPEPDVDSSQSGFSLGRNMVEIPEEGGSAFVPYFIENPQDGYEVAVDNAQEFEWIEFDLTEPEEIGIIVEKLPLDEDSREAVVVVSYGEEEQSFTVSQMREDTNPAFSLEVTRTSTESVWAKIEPTDPDMHFWINIMETEKFNSFATDDELFAEDVKWFEKIADIYYNGNMDKFYWDQFENTTYLSPHSQMRSSYNLADDVKDADLEVQPSTDYTVYCYGMDGDGNRLTRVYSAEARTKDIVSDNAVTYTIDVNVLDQTVYSTITPSDDNQLYFTESMLYEDSEAAFTDEELRSMAQQSIDMSIFMIYGAPSYQEMGLTVEQIVESMFPKGKMNGEKQFMYSDRDGVAFAFSIDEEGQIVSQAYTEKFHLDAPGQSGNEIELKVSDITPWSASYTAVPVDKKETYLVYNLEADFIDGWTDEQIMQHLAAKQNWYDFAHDGDLKGELKALERNTEYVLVAFGYKNASPITELFKYEYKTQDAPVADVDCSLSIKYFNGDEVLELYPEFGGGLAMNAFVYIEAVPSENASEYHYTILNDESYLPFLNDGEPVYAKDFTDDQALYLLKDAVSTPVNTIFSEYNASYTAYAVAVDADGNYGPVYRQKIVFTREGCLPIEDLPALAPAGDVNYAAKGVELD